MSSEIVIYKMKDGSSALDVKLEGETVWLSQAQMAELFGKDVRTVSEHVNNIFREEELDKDSVIRKFRITASDGKSYNTVNYNLDVIISVGYRVNSKQGTLFRQWATKVLRGHILKGYTINRDRIKENYAQFLEAVDQVKHLLPSGSSMDHGSVLELINLFADTWFSLDAYDKDQLTSIGTTKKKVRLTAKDLSLALMELKETLVAHGEATDLFGRERSPDSVFGIVGNVLQSFGDKELYPTIEEKAAHLLYFIIKNHPFIDGNKRSGAYAFIWFLRQAKILDVTRITPPALTAITLLIAESHPKDKDKMVGLVCHLLERRKKTL